MLDGGIAAVTDDGPIALLRYVPGEEPPDDESGLRLIGTTLGRVHSVLRGVEFGERFHWVDPAAAHLDRTPEWVRPGIAAALRSYDELDPASLTWGMLHTDPAPEAFLVDPDSGNVGLIDWSVAMYGPLLYDLASAVLYVGGPDQAAPLVDAYLMTGALTTAEVARGLNVFHRFRWAVQADYFAARLAANDLTGIDDAVENEAGMLAARSYLT
jgi:Ser/Thr protein kinase RdoA (MazF antagonist)